MASKFFVCQSPKIADNAYGARSLLARTMAGIPPSACTLYLVSPQGGCQNSKRGKAAGNFAIFQDFGAKTGGAGRIRNVRPTFPRGDMRGQICRQDVCGGYWDSFLALQPPVDKLPGLDWWHATGFAGMLKAHRQRQTQRRKIRERAGRTMRLYTRRTRERRGRNQ